MDRGEDPRDLCLGRPHGRDDALHLASGAFTRGNLQWRGAVALWFAAIG